MEKRRTRFVPGIAFASENLESRLVLSAIGSGATAEAVRKVATRTTLAVSAGTLGQPITFTATVRAPAASGSPAGTVEVLDHGTAVETITLTPIASTNPKYAYSEATATLTQPAGGTAYYFGRHTLSAVFVPSGAASTSTGNSSFTVAKPAYTTLAGGVETATVAAGSGAAIQSGQTANLLYTGYLSKNGKVFDESSQHGGALLSFTLGAGQVIPGFDAGVTGMKAGETRLIVIPPAEAYGSTPNGAIPANSTLVFEVTLESIS